MERERGETSAAHERGSEGATAAAAAAGAPCTAGPRRWSPSAWTPAPWRSRHRRGASAALCPPSRRRRRRPAAWSPAAAPPPRRPRAAPGAAAPAAAPGPRSARSPRCAARRRGGRPAVCGEWRRRRRCGGGVSPRASLSTPRRTAAEGRERWRGVTCTRRRHRAAGAVRPSPGRMAGVFRAVAGADGGRPRRRRRASGSGRWRARGERAPGRWRGAWRAPFGAEVERERGGAAAVAACCGGLFCGCWTSQRCESAQQCTQLAGAVGLCGFFVFFWATRAIATQDFRPRRSPLLRSQQRSVSQLRFILVEGARYSLRSRIREMQLLRAPAPAARAAAAVASSPARPRPAAPLAQRRRAAAVLATRSLTEVETAAWRAYTASAGAAASDVAATLALLRTAGTLKSVAPEIVEGALLALEAAASSSGARARAACPPACRPACRCRRPRSAPSSRQIGPHRRRPPHRQARRRRPRTCPAPGAWCSAPLRRTAAGSTVRQRGGGGEDLPPTCLVRLRLCRLCLRSQTAADFADARTHARTQAKPLLLKTSPQKPQCRSAKTL